MFQSSSELGVANIFFKGSNVEECHQFSRECIELGSGTGDQRNGILLEEEPVGQSSKPGLRDIKQVELWKNFVLIAGGVQETDCAPYHLKFGGEKNEADEEFTRRREKGGKKVGTISK
jgi:hypothetical protein